MDEINPEMSDREQAPAPNLRTSGGHLGLQQTAGQPIGEDANSEANTRKRQEQALMFERYLEESGLCLSFQIIFTEII